MKPTSTNPGSTRRSQLADLVFRHFPDREQGDFYFTADDQESLITRTKELFDGSIPGSNALLATALLRLGKLTGRADYLSAADRILGAAAGVLRAPEAVAQMLVAVDLQLGPTWEITLTGDPAQDQTARVLRTLRRTYSPRHVMACRGPAGSSVHSVALDPLFTGKPLLSPEPIAYVCEGSICREPVVGVERIVEAWQGLGRRA